MKTIDQFHRSRTARGHTTRLRTGVAVLLTGVSGGAGFGAAPALAQAPVIDEVVVTARFREENLQQTPLAITALNADMLEAKSANSVLEIEKYAPNVTINQLGAGWGPTLAASIRGIGLGDFKAVYEPGVPIYVDDVVLGRPTGANLDLLDLERVEVLRGPQGTLFGRNAAGGVIRLISRKPTGDGPAFIEGTYGSYNRMDVRGAFEASFADNLHARFSFSAKRRDGYVDVLDYTCVQRQNGTPENAGYGDGLAWDPAAGGGDGALVNVTPGSEADNLTALPDETSPPGTSKGCKTDELGDENSQAGRMMLRYVASDDFEVTLAADITDENHGGPADTMLSINPDLGLVQAYNAAVALPNYGIPFDERFVTGDPYSIYSTFEDDVSGIETPNVTKITHWGVSSSFDYLGSEALSAKLILAYREFTTEFGRDSDGSPMGINHTYDYFKDQQYTAELRFAGTLFDGFTDWTLGGFYYKADDYNSNISVLYPGVLRQGVVDRIDDQESESKAIFLHTVNHLSDRFTLTAGVRYTDDQKDIVQTRLLRPTPSDPETSLQFPVTPSTQSSSRVTPMASLQYQLTEDVMTYATYARGYRGGGFNPRPSSPATVNSFAPEDIDSFEGGFKSDLFDNRLRFNTTGFFMIYKNLQLPTVFIEPDGAVTFPPANAGKAHVYGVEMELQANPVEGVLLDGSLGYLGFEYQSLGNADPAVIEANGGNAASSPCLDCRPARSPKWTIGFGAQYTAFLGADMGSLTFRGDLTYQSRTDFAVNNLDRAAQSGYALVDGRITWDVDEDWSMAVFATNILDKEYFVSVLDFQDSLGGIQASYARPREWGVSVKRRF